MGIRNATAQLTSTFAKEMKNMSKSLGREEESGAAHDPLGRRVLGAQVESRHEAGTGAFLGTVNGRGEAVLALPVLGQAAGDMEHGQLRE